MDEIDVERRPPTKKWNTVRFLQLWYMWFEQIERNRLETAWMSSLLSSFFVIMCSICHPFRRSQKELKIIQDEILLKDR